jgi:carotenoid cleavage dioxygenase-like enzyme
MAMHVETATRSSSPTAPRARGWRGALRDLPREHGFEALTVEGALPADLVGTLYRNGPGRFSAGGEAYGHWFDGDGTPCAIRLGDGRALGAARVVQTSGLLREQRAKRRLFGGYDTPLVRPIRELLLGDAKNPANTAILVWQGRVFATCEAGKPYEIGPDDLSTIGETDLGVIVGAFSAHHHRVAARRTTYNFGLAHGPKGTTVTMYALPDDGAARAIGSFSIRGVRLIHDFAVTPRHLVFVVAPMRLALLSVLFGKGPVSSARWDERAGAEIVVVPIDDPKAITRVGADAFMMEHVVNAFEDGGEIVFDYTHYASSYALEGAVRGLVRGQVEAPLGSSIRRGRVDPARRTFRSEPVLDRTVELPRVSPRVEAQRHRFAYHVEVRQNGFFEQVLKHDADTGRLEAYAPDGYPGEAVFVPRPDARAEDDGWLLTLVYDARKDRSRLEVLDARAIADGPIASCAFDHALPAGFHGQWRPERPDAA